MKDIINSKVLIQNTRKRFIAWTTVILLIVLLVSIMLRAVLLVSENKKEVEETLNILVSVDSDSLEGTQVIDERISADRILIVKFISYVTPYGTNLEITNVKTGSATFTSEEIADYVKKSYSGMITSESASGRTGNIYFRFASLTAGGNTLYAVDRTAQINEAIKILLAFSALLLSVFCVLDVLFIFISKKIIEPVEQIFNAQREFVSNASHELKTPMSIIAANADVITDDGKDKEWVANIKEQVKKMNGLVEDMLTLAKIDEGHIEKEIKNFNLSKALSTTTLPFEAVAFERKKQMKFDIEPEVFIVGHEKDYKDIVNILIDNAIKYADERGEINVILERNGKYTRTFVRNTGCNIDEQEKDRVFERFYRADKSHTSGTGGTGLGLSIAKALADDNGWKLEVNLKKDDFTEFVLTI